ncbi:MAG: S8 family serine peptidase [Fimbriimonadaceae bacterium]|nr:S8 family serine peptidase [Fimbriimonadaceae bacterium]QYK57101.1 MAG: S8 family serine peptidase [Fimbriimonadaceae bacterium]
MARTLLTLAALSAVTLAVASPFGAGGRFGPYIQEKGELEFTGTMIARPYLPSELMKLGASPSRAQALYDAALRQIKPLTLRSYPEVNEFILKVPRGDNENAMSKRFMGTGAFDYVTPNWKKSLAVAPVTPNDPMFGQQWHHTVMQCPLGWFYGSGTSNVTVAVVDTGMDIGHPDLRAAMVRGYNSVDRLPQAQGGKVQDINGHGTHVAGDAAAVGNNGVGVCGVGWGFRIMPIRTSNEPGGGASGEDILAGARWAVDHGAKVVSASYTGVDDPAVETTAQYVEAKGGLFLYAAGNDGRNLSGFQYRSTIVVGASDEADRKAGFSAFGRGVSIFAPGVNILSTTNGGGFGFASGTSMATPVANGAVALIWSISPNLEPADVRDILYATADKIGPASTFSNGRVNVARAAAMAYANRFSKNDIRPASVARVLGTYVSGTLDDVASPNAAGYVLQDEANASGERAAMASVTFDAPTAASSLRYLEPTVTVSATNTATTTAFLYVWNTKTNRWDYLQAQQTGRSGGATLKLRLVDNIGPYVSSDRKVKVGVRVMSGYSRGGRVPDRFKSNLQYANLRAAIKS